MLGGSAEVAPVARPYRRAMTTEATTPRDVLLAGVPVTERRLDAAGTSTVVLEGGAGPPIVLLHGPGGNGTHWARVIGALTRTHRVVVPDLPGHGGSQAPEPLDVAAVLGWLDALLEATCEQPAVLVGNACGGAISARYAAAGGERLARLVLVDPLGLEPFAPAPQFGAALQAFIAEPTMETHEDLWRYCARDLDRLRDGMGERWSPFAAYNVDRARRPAVQAAIAGLIGQFALSGIAAEELAAIDVPVTLIHGRHDLATPLAVAQRASSAFGWPLYVIEHAADIPPLEQPSAFVAALRRALSADPAAFGLAALRPGDDGFAEATRLWNGMIETRPAFVVRPAGTADVMGAVAFAREAGLPLAVRGGGHNIAGRALAPAGVTLDLSGLRRVVVDPEARTATVQPGCLLADVDRATQEHGLATPLGFLSQVGVAGLTLGGGLGYLTRRFGWTVDNLLAAEIVTADGKIRRASRDEHADLFWALRGAGANLGVVTELTFRLHEVGPTVLGGLIAWPFERAAEIAPAYRALTAEAPRELAVWMNLIRAPAAPFVPPQWHGERIVAMAVCYSGELERAEEALAPLRALGDPVFDLLHEQPYTEVQSYLDDTEPKGHHYYWRTEYAAELSDEFLTTWLELAAECPIPAAQLGCLHVGGALNERAGDDGAVGNRDARFVCGVLGAWEPGEPHADAFRQWVRDAHARIRPFGTGASYVNFQTGDEGVGRLRESYGVNCYRVIAVKRRYDPGDLFRSFSILDS